MNGAMSLLDSLLVYKTLQLIVQFSPQAWSPASLSLCARNWPALDLDFAKFVGAAVSIQQVSDRQVSLASCFWSYVSNNQTLFEVATDSM